VLDQNVDFYGGTFALKIPDGLKDMSEVRQVPNHQEFYADVDKGMNVITEINEYQSQVSDEKINDFFFANLAKDTSAKLVQVFKKGKAEMPGAKDNFTSYIIGKTPKFEVDE